MVKRINGKKVLSIEDFLARVTQVGLRELASSQIACVLHFISDPDLQEYVVLEDLAFFLQHEGVKMSRKGSSPMQGTAVSQSKLSSSPFVFDSANLQMSEYTENKGTISIESD